jgi:hypothetical protein
MEDVKLNPNMKPISETRVITNPDGTLSTEEVRVTWVDVSEDGKVITQTWESGFMVISSTVGYTESHTVHVVAYDAAGNMTESEGVRFYIVHEPKEKEDANETGEIWWREDDALVAGDRGPEAGARSSPLLAGVPPLWWRGFG